MVDTGANISLLQLDVFKKLHKNKVLNYHKLDENTNKIMGVTGNSVAPIAKAEIEMSLGKERIIMPVFIVSNIKQELIMGSDTIRKYKILVDISNNCILFQNKIIPFSQCSDHVFSVSLA